jgi:hypothetical protein
LLPSGSWKWAEQALLVYLGRFGGEALGFQGREACGEVLDAEHDCDAGGGFRRGVFLLGVDAEDELTRGGVELAVSRWAKKKATG